MSPLEPLDQSLQYDLLPETQRAIIARFWKRKLTALDYKKEATKYDTYFRYYEDECKAWADGNSMRGAVTHSHVAEIVDRLETETLESIRSSLRHVSQSNPYPLPSTVYNETTDGSIALAVRLWLMLCVRAPDDESHQIGQMKIPWKDGRLDELVSKLFPSKHVLNDSVKLGKAFNALSLEKVAGIEIIWTSNLADHLRMMEDDTRVAIFHHAYFLAHHRDCETPNKFLPRDLLEETLQTLALLLPQFDRETQKWLRQQQSEWNLDPRTAKCGGLNAEQRKIENFKYWRDRLVILKQVYDESEPKTIGQWWHDRRKRVQWYTFWVAAVILVLTVVFGIIQSIEGGLQAWKAFHS
ncbi:MAG: hypothetical protein M1839_008362 [Geoglossum umbratile]|nr:MAG: hypothetical protein M1839_008362 [Geoglossum umbratile]